MATHDDDTVGLLRSSIFRGFMHAEPLLMQEYERRAEDYTRAAEQTDDLVFRNMLLTLALQWKLAAREEAAMQSTEPEAADFARS